ncbi:hypothetical protein FKM82_016311 [Ascaphus truei]
MSRSRGPHPLCMQLPEVFSLLGRKGTSLTSTSQSTQSGSPHSEVRLLISDASAQEQSRTFKENPAVGEEEEAHCS